MTPPASVTHDDLFWLLGQKEATLLLVTRQAQALMAENARLTAEVASLTLAHEADTHGTNDRQALDTPISAEAAQ